MPDATTKREQLEKDRLEKLSAICLALPQAVRENQLSHASFRVTKKVFVYYLNNHHGDGIVTVCCKVLPGDNERLIAANPQKFIMPAYIGPRGWVGLRLDRSTVDWVEVKELVHGSYAADGTEEAAQVARRNLIGAAANALAKPHSQTRPRCAAAIPFPNQNRQNGEWSPTEQLRAPLDGSAMSGADQAEWFPRAVGYIFSPSA